MSVLTPEFIRRLSVDEKLELIDQLKESLDDESTFPQPTYPLTDAMKRELDRRIAESDANPGVGIPREVVEAEVKERLRQIRSR